MCRRGTLPGRPSLRWLRAEVGAGGAAPEVSAGGARAAQAHHQRQARLSPGFGVLQLLARKAMGPEEGAVEFQIDDGAAHGCALRVRWDVYGDFRLWRRNPRLFHVSAISHYSVVRREFRARLLWATLLWDECDEGSSLLAYRIHRQSIVFMETHATQIMSMLLGQSLRPEEFGLALHSTASGGPSLARGGGRNFPAAVLLP